MTPGYRALREGAAWFDVSARGRIRVTGEDRARLLHAMSTNDVQGLTPGQGCYAFFLNAQGRILCDANVFCFEDHLLLDTEPETRKKLFEHLDRYIIADDVTLTDETDTTAAIAVEGPQAFALLAHLGASVPEALHGWTTWGTRAVARVTVDRRRGSLRLYHSGRQTQRCWPNSQAEPRKRRPTTPAPSASNTAIPATATKLRSATSSRKPDNCKPSALAKAAIWARRSWNACAAARKFIACCGGWNSTSRSLPLRA